MSILTSSKHTSNKDVLRARLLEALNSKPPSRPLRITLPVPLAPPSTLLRALPATVAFCWEPVKGLGMSGVGVALEIPVVGRESLDQLRRQAQELFDRIDIENLSEQKVPPPRLFGGLAFATGMDHGSLWKGFGDGRFLLPQWSYDCTLENGFISLNLASEKPDPQEISSQFDTIWDAFERPPTSSSSSPGDQRSHVFHLNPEVWNRRVKEIRELIRNSETLQKVVTVRTSRLEPELPEVFDEFTVMDRLSEFYPHCNHFLVRRKEASFLGASPEILFAKRGTELFTQALAGSVRIHPNLTSSEAGQALMKSPKNREEHAIVVREIEALLQPLANEIHHSAIPEVMRLRELLHLETPIRAQLKPTTDVLDLLEALHPTPAVAGWPRHEAMEWIAANEGEHRGWYTGPVGWFDAAGDGTMAVAIRCTLVENHQAHAFAGAGIMHDSDPPMEYAETAVKLQAALRALGAVPG